MGLLCNCCNLCDRACKKRRSEHCPNNVVRWKKAVEVGGDEERRLGGGCGESFLNEGSEQYRPLRGSCTSAQITESKVREDLFLQRRGNDILDSACSIIAVQIHSITQL